MQCKRPSNEPDKEDRELLKGKSPNYILGWNKIKHRGYKDELERTAKPVGRAKKSKA